MSVLSSFVSVKHTFLTFVKNLFSGVST